VISFSVTPFGLRVVQPVIAEFKPWELVWYCAFPDKYRALEFEKYLKSHSGRAFAKKRL